MGSETSEADERARRMFERAVQRHNDVPDSALVQKAPAPTPTAPDERAVKDMETFVLGLRAAGIRRYKGVVPGTSIPLEMEFHEQRRYADEE